MYAIIPRAGKRAVSWCFLHLMAKSRLFQVLVRFLRLRKVETASQSPRKESLFLSRSTLGRGATVVSPPTPPPRPSFPSR